MLGGLSASEVDPLCCLRTLCFLCVRLSPKSEVKSQKAKVKGQKSKVEEGREDGAGASGRGVPTQ